jgi:hypothetical protein
LGYLLARIAHVFGDGAGLAGNPDRLSSRRSALRLRRPTMQQHRSQMFHETDDQADDRQTASLGAVAITLLLLVIGVFLVREMRTAPVIENGMMATMVNRVADPAI